MARKFSFVVLGLAVLLSIVLLNVPSIVTIQAGPLGQLGQLGQLDQLDLALTPTPQTDACTSSAVTAPSTAAATSAATELATAAPTSTGDTEAQDRAIACQYYAAVNQNKLDQLADIVADDVADHNPIGGQKPGLDGLKQRLNVFRRAFPNLQLTVDDLLVKDTAKDSTIVGRVTARGNLRGGFYRLQITGQRVTWHAIDMFRIADGKIVELWHVEDVWSIALGQLPTLTPSPTKVTTATVTVTPRLTTTPTAVPNTAVPAAPNPNPAYLGIVAAPIGEGVRIENLFDGSPASSAFLHRGDLIYAVDGQTLQALHQPGEATLADTFFRVIAAHHPGDKIILSLRRAGRQMDVEVTLGVRPSWFTGGNES